MNSSTYDGSTSFVCPNGCRSGACIASQKIARIDVIAPSEVITNEAFDMTVRILDTDGKKITNYEGTIYFEVDQSATNPDVVLPV